MTKEILDLRVHGPKVFKALVTKPHLGFTLLKADPTKQTVDLQTPMSWFSWGETLHVTVVNGDSGCKVIIEGRRSVFQSILANPARATARLISGLADRYGDKITPQPSDESAGGR